MKLYKLLFVAVFAVSFVNLSAQNSWFVSETGNDTSGDGSQGAPWATISHALSESSVVGGDTIQVSGTITENGLGAAGVEILKNVIIKGEAKETSIVQAATENATATGRVFTNLSHVKMINITIRYGYFNASSYNYGAGILNWGVLTLENCIVTENYIENPELGGGIYNEFGVLYLLNTTVESNYSDYGGAGIVTEGGSLNVEKSTIALNYCQHNLASGGGIFVTDTAEVNIKNSTIYYNLMGLNSYGAGISVKGDNAHSGTIHLNMLNVTVADNESGAGSFGNGLYVENNVDNPVVIQIKNCIFSNGNTNNYGETGNNITLLRSHTLCRDATIPMGEYSGNIDNTDPLISSFGDNGGETHTAALSSGSPAINSGTDEGAPPTDQRGFDRVGITDMGSYEVQTGANVKSVNNIVKICPNPSTGLFNITIPDKIKKITIFDITGRTVLTTDKTEIDITKHSVGVYFIKVETQTNTFTKKIIKD